MSSLLYGLGRLSARRAWSTIAAWAAVLVVAGVAAVAVGTGVSNVYTIPSTESQDAQERLEQLFPQTSGGSAQVVAVMDGAVTNGAVTEDPARSAVEAVVDRLADVDQVASVRSPFDESGAATGDVAPDDASVSDSGRAAIVRIQFDVVGTQVSDATLAELTRVADEATTDDVAFSAGGAAFSQRSVGIAATDLVGVGVALLVLGIVFRSALAAGVPVVVAIVGVAAGMGVVLAATRWVDVIPSAPLLALMLGIAVGIDYALFILARHRDQLGDGLDLTDSIGRAVATAGSAVVFAGITNVVALAALGLAGIPFLTVMGVSASVAVVTAVAASLTLLPAVLGLLGHRLAPRAPSPRRRATAPDGLAGRWVAAVTRVPLLTVVVLTVGLGVASIPAADLRLALPDNGSDEVGTPSRDTYDLVSEEFGPGYSSRLLVVGDVVASTDPLGTVEGVAADLADLDGVVAVTLATVNPTADTLLVQVVPAEGPSADSTADLVDEIRAEADRIEGDHGVVDLAVTGTTALGIDVSTRLEQVLLPYGVLVVVLSLGLLAMVFRSVAVPLKTGVGYLLSVGSALGAIVAVYQWGWLAGPLQTVYVGPVVSFLPIILMGVLFGLAMDYELFLVSRMREAYVTGGDARAAVRTGFVQSSRIVTTLAVIMVSVFVAFVPAGDAILQPIALGLAVGVAVDAFLVRLTLVPAVMALLGRRAWWLPRWLDRALPGVDVEGEGMTRLTRLRDWPAPGTPPGVHAAGLLLGGRRERIVEGVGLAVGPGEALQVSGGTALARSSLLLAIAGRLAPGAGTLKVAGRLLPEESGAVRARVALVRAGDEDDPAAAVRERVGRRTIVLVVDEVDETAGDARRRELLEEVERQRRDGGRTVVVGGTAAALASSPLARSASHRLDLGRHSEPVGSQDPSAPGGPVGWPASNGAGVDRPTSRVLPVAPETEGVS